MAMTKGEKERMAQLERAVRLARAMRWPEYPMPEPLTEEQIKANLVPGGLHYGHTQMVALGWLANSHRPSVEAGCSNGTNHGTGNTTSTQGAGRLYASELEAWQAIRIAMTERHAEQLARVDAEIERLV